MVFAHAPGAMIRATPRPGGDSWCMATGQQGRRIYATFVMPCRVGRAVPTQYLSISRVAASSRLPIEVFPSSTNRKPIYDLSSRRESTSRRSPRGQSSRAVNSGKLEVTSNGKVATLRIACRMANGFPMQTQARPELTGFSRARSKETLQVLYGATSQARPAQLFENNACWLRPADRARRAMRAGLPHRLGPP